MNRESICKQQIHCLSCPLSVRITGKDCRTLTHKELIEMIVKEPDNLCVICGAVIPEGRQVCPICGATESTLFEACKPTPIAEPQTEFKVDDTQEQAFYQGYITGFKEGMNAACELKLQNEQLKQQNEQLRRRIVVLENQARNTVDDIDGEFE